MNNIFSYYKEFGDGRRQEETLEQHIRKALQYASEIENSRVMRLAERIKGGRQIQYLANLSIILHDAGKAFYQDNRRNEGGCITISFAGHEFISALIAKLFTDQLISRGYGDNLRAIVFAVYYHHHAMNPNHRKRFLNDSLRRANEKANMIHPLFDTLSQFMDDEQRSALHKALEELPKKIKEGVGYIQNNLEYIIYDEFMKSANPAPRKIALLTLNILLSCDYLSASGRGEGSTSTFSSAIRQYHSLWLRP